MKCNTSLIESVRVFIIDNSDPSCSKTRIAYFFHWLRKNNLLYGYLSNFSYKYKNSIGHSFSLPLLLTYSFHWAPSKEGHDFWHNIALNWNLHIRERIEWIRLLN